MLRANIMTGTLSLTLAALGASGCTKAGDEPVGNMGNGIGTPTPGVPTAGAPAAGATTPGGPTGPSSTAFGAETGASSTGTGAPAGTPPAQGGAAGPGPAGSASTPEELFPDVEWDAFTVVYSPMYSAYDGVHTFQVPVYTNGITTDVEAWHAFPPDAVSFSPWESDDGMSKGVMITVERAEPEVTIAVTRGGLGGKATLYITEATPQDWELGKERYQRGTSLEVDEIVNMFLSDPDFAMNIPNFSQMIEVTDDGVVFSGTAADLGLQSDMRCDTCHTKGAENFQVQHTPTQAARFSDQDLVNIFRTGTKPEGVGYRVLPEAARSFYQVMHKWDATDAEIKGLVTYLRSLEPEGQGDILLPAGILVGGNFDVDQLPPACNPQGAMFDVVTCLLILPPACQAGTEAFNIQACADGLGVSLDTTE